MNRWLGGIGLALVLGGCSMGVGKTQQRPAVYDLGPPAAALVRPAELPRLSWQLQGPAWLDAEEMRYRLAYADLERQHDYALASWAGSPLSLLRQRLRQLLGAGGGKCVLRLELDEFVQVFASAQLSSGDLQLRAELSDSKRRLLAEKSFRVSVPASSADARGGAQALAKASGELAVALLNWEKVVLQGEVLAACRD
ncbi:MAG: hypothetical protein RIR00_410 [Pseudomonadota bacterium]|jgi:cholesterol transport system auxiliary component